MVNEMSPKFEFDLALLLGMYRIQLIRVETTYSMRHFGTVLRALVGRKPGELGLGGVKYVSMYIDALDNVYSEDFILKLVRISWAAYKFDQVMSIWGFVK
jgi:hypothetical protein